MEQCAKQHLPLPRRIQDAPELLPGLEPYFEAFMELTMDRPAGWIEQAIPRRDIVAWAGDHGIVDQDDVERCISLVRAMDLEYLKYRERKRKQ